MKQKTYAAKAIEAADRKTLYDAHMKYILSDKGILANILKCTVDEVKELSIKEIIDSICDVPEVANVSIEPGLTNAHLHRDNSEDRIPNEGDAYFDIRCHITIPVKEQIRILINVEAQNTYHPGYDIVTRGIFYCARMISSQKDTEFFGSDYDSLKKVYSIWICTKVPEKIAGSITEYKMGRFPIYGNYDSDARYDLLSVVVIGLGADNLKVMEPTANKMMRIILSDMNINEKKTILEKEFFIPMTYELEKEMNTMCNLSEYIEERGIERGIERGREQEKEQSIRAFIVRFKEKKVPKEQIVADLIEVFGITMKEAEKYI